MKYLKGTMNLGIHFENMQWYFKDIVMKILNLAMMRPNFTSGYVFTFGGRVFS
jgi:hypothetical protein